MKLLRLLNAMLLILILLGISRVQAASVPQDGLLSAGAESPPPPPRRATPSAVTADAAAAPTGIGSLSGSFVTFDPAVGGDTCFTPGVAQTFCFRAESFTNDFEYVYNLWQRFPADWTVNNVYVQGTPSCTNGGTWGGFSWSFQTSPYEVNITHYRYQAATDHCTAYYCFEVTSGSGAPDALESWYWHGDGYGSSPHHPCSDDGYTPAGQPACDEAAQPQASIPPCTLPPIMLTPSQIDAEGCPCQVQEHTFTLWNNTGYDTDVNLTYSVIAGSGTCTGPGHVFVYDGNTRSVVVSLAPAGAPGDTVVCQVYAEDASNPANNDTSLLVKHLVARYFDPAGWQTEPITNATPHQWAGSAVGTHPAAAGPVGYVVGGLSSVSTLNPDLQMYDPGTATWTQLTDMPNPRFSPVVGWIDGLLYAAGGYDASFVATNDLQVYNPATNSWDNSTYADMPNLRGGGAGGVGTCSSGTGECLFHVGGGPDSSLGHTTLETWQYDPTANAWTQLDNKPAGSSPDGLILGAGVGCLGKIYVGGDYRGYHEFYALDATQPAGSQWTQLANIPAAAGAMTPAFVCKEDWGKILLIGGDPDGWWNNYNNTVYVYDIASDTWEGPLPQTLNVGQLGSVGWHLDGKVWTVGGTVGSGPISPMPFESLLQIPCATCPAFHVWKEAPAQAAPGQVISYTIFIETDSLLSGSSMVDPLPPGVAYAGNLSSNIGDAWYDSATNAVYWMPPRSLYGAANLMAGSYGPSNLYAIDPQSGAATLIGPIGFDNVTGLAFLPDGRLVGSARGDDLYGGTPTAILIEINPATGAGTLIGVISDYNIGCGRMPDLTYDPATDTLYGYGDYCDGAPEGLFIIDPDTGAGTPVGPSGYGGGGNGLAIDRDSGIIYATPFDNNSLVTLDPVTGQGTDVPGSVGKVPHRVNALAFDPLSGVLYGSWSDPGNPNKLVTISTADGTTTVVGETVLGLDALVFAGSATLERAAAVQPAVDETLGLPAPATMPPASPSLPAVEPQVIASPQAVLDDFNRADGPIGPNWTVRDGFCNVSSNAAVCGSMGRATFNNYTGDGNVAEADIAAVGTALEYTGLLLNYGAGSSNLFLKVQNQSGGNQFGHAGCYTGNNGPSSFGLGFFALSSPFTTAHMRATRVGSDVTIEFTNIDGGTQPDQTYVCSGAPAPEGTGIGILGYAGIARLDNFGLPGGGPVQVAITFNVTVTADCGEVVHNHGWATNGFTVVEFGANTNVLGEPDITVDPPALWDTLYPDSTDTMPMTICNVGTCDLIWELHEYTPTLLANSTPFVPVKVEGSGINPGLTTASPQARVVAVPSSPEAVLWDQPLSSVNQSAHVDQEFTDYPDFSSFLADDFVNVSPWAISTIFVPGNGWNGFTTLMNADSLTWQIYADDGTGFPDGDPHGGGNPPVWTLTLLPSDPQVVLSNGSAGMLSNVTLNLATPLVLPPGHWWLVFYPTMAFGTGGQYGRQPADTTNGYIGKFINPGGGFGYGTDWRHWTVLSFTQHDIAFRLEGESAVTYADYPWLSESPIASMLLPGECTVVDVTFDSTGLAPGDYRANLLILSNDPDTPQVTVPVTMTVSPFRCFLPLVTRNF